MTPLRLIIGVACVLAAVGLLTSPSDAWQYGQRNAPKPVDFAKLKNIDFAGQVTAVGPGIIGSVNATNEQVVIYISPNPQETRVTIIGEADSTVLKSQTYISFVGTIDEAGKLSAPVGDLMLITPAPLIDPEEIAIGSDTTLMGKLLKVKDNKFEMLAMGKRSKKISGEFVSEPKITLALTDHTIASPGDALVIKGKELEKNKILAQDVQITLAKPLSTGKKRPASSKPEEGEKPEVKPAEGDKPAGEKPAAEGKAAAPEAKP